ncbi:Exosome complex exonuclease RRP42, partial [Termitomyces sp. T112]
GKDGGRIVCTVACSPSAYPHLSSSALDDIQADLTSLLHQTISHSSLHPSNLTILKSKKSWLLNLDVLVLSDAGNILDALFMASRAALWDTRVPRTRGVEYKAPTRKDTGKDKEDMNVDEDEHENAQKQSGFDTRVLPKATDFELPDYWDEGEVLDGRERWPVAITLNIESPTHFLDATAQEEAASPLKLLLAFSFHDGQPAVLQGMRMLGPGELTPSHLKELVKVGENYARELFVALNAKLKDEDVRRTQKARERFELHR